MKHHYTVNLNYEKILIDNADGSLGDINLYIRIKSLCFLNLRRLHTVGKHDAVGREAVITGTVTEISAISQTLLTVMVLPQSLIEVVLDKAALVHGILVLKVGV